MGGDDLENLLAGLAVKGHALSRFLRGWSTEAIQRQHVRDRAAKWAERLSIAQYEFGEAAAIGQGGQFDLVVREHDGDGRRRGRPALDRRIRLAETIPGVGQSKGPTRFH